ncbi:hypothetical protein J6590_075899 [Homalodisca vitripennis]|nr:hypothetical protein J6590_075899 [Homalodisca vitripennis]
MGKTGFDDGLTPTDQTCPLQLFRGPRPQDDLQGPQKQRAHGSHVSHVSHGYHVSRVSLDGYQFHNFYSSSSNHRLEITVLRLQLQCLVPRRRHPGCESTHCEGKVGWGGGGVATPVRAWQRWCSVMDCDAAVAANLTLNATDDAGSAALEFRNDCPGGGGGQPDHHHSVDPPPHVLVYEHLPDSSGRHGPRLPDLCLYRQLRESPGHHGRRVPLVLAPLEVRHLDRRLHKSVFFTFQCGDTIELYVLLGKLLNRHWESKSSI